MRLPSLLPLPLLFVAATASATTQQPLQPLSGGYSTLKTRISKLLLESSGSNKNKVALVVEEEEVSTLKSFSGRDIPVLKVTSAADTDAASSSTFPSRVLVVGSFAGNESNVVGGWCLGLVEALLSNINTTAITTGKGCSNKDCIVALIS